MRCGKIRYLSHVAAQAYRLPGRYTVRMDDAALAALRDHLPAALRFLRLAWTRVPGFDLELPLVDPASLVGPLAREAAAVVDAEPPYWTVVWPAGRVLAAWIADRPTLLRGRRVVDLGCGAGLTALIAARAGASVTAVDLDPGALTAVNAAARRNGLDVQIASTTPPEADLVLAADLLYAPEHAALLAPWTARGVAVLAADCRAGESTAQAAGLQPVGAAQSSVWPDLDRSTQFRTVRIWQASLDRAGGV